MSKNIIPFLWQYFEEPVVKDTPIIFYDEKQKINLFFIDNKFLPLTFNNVFFRKTFTVTEIKDEHTDED